MKLMASIHTRIVNALAAISGAMLALFTIGICYDVTLRALGFQPQFYIASMVEYGLLYVTVLSAPWLLRENGHVFVDMVTRAMAPGLKRATEYAVYVLAFVACIILAWAAAYLSWENYLRGEMEIRDFNMPRWLIYSPMALSFALLAVEFLRCMSGVSSLYEGDSRSAQL